MPAQSVKLRSILVLLVLLVASVVLLNRTATVPVSASGGTVSVIVQFKDAPAAVYQARAAKSGQTVSAEALQSYRNQLAAKQDQFLKSLEASGVTASVIARNVN